METGWYELSGDVVGCRFGKRVAGLLRVGTPEFECRSVEAVAARLCLGGHEPRDCFAELGIVVLRSDLHFGNRVEVGIDDRDADDWVLIVSAIQFVAGGEGELAVAFDLLAALRVLGFVYSPADVSGAGS